MSNETLISPPSPRAYAIYYSLTTEVAEWQAENACTDNYRFSTVSKKLIIACSRRFNGFEGGIRRHLSAAGPEC